jgi:hypothetical protein
MVVALWFPFLLAPTATVVPKLGLGYLDAPATAVVAKTVTSPTFAARPRASQLRLHKDLRALAGRSSAELVTNDILCSDYTAKHQDKHIDIASKILYSKFYRP